MFDGRRRYNIEFTFLRDEPVKLENGLYSGKAHLCQLHYNQIAGFKPKLLKEGRALPPAFAWVAEIPSAAAPHGRYLLPLKLWASTGFGTVTATLTQMKVEDSPTRDRMSPPGHSRIAALQSCFLSVSLRSSREGAARGRAGVAMGFVRAARAGALASVLIALRPRRSGVRTIAAADRSLRQPSGDFRAGACP